MLNFPAGNTRYICWPDVFNWKHLLSSSCHVLDTGCRHETCSCCMILQCISPGQCAPVFTSQLSISLSSCQWLICDVTFKMFSILFCWRTMDFCLQVNIELQSVLLLTCHWPRWRSSKWLKLLQNPCVH